MLRHRIWTLFDKDMMADEVRGQIINEGISARAADVFLQEHSEAVAAATHSEEERFSVLESVRDAVVSGKPEHIFRAMDKACDDDRTLYQAFVLLSNLLFGSHPLCQWAALGLSRLTGFGDFALAQALQHDAEINRFVGAFGLCQMGADGSNAIDALRAAAKDPSELVRDMCEEAIETIEAAAAV